MASDILLRASGLTKRFGAKVALDGVSFAAGRGEIVGVIGANGAGKSTLMGIFAGLVEPDEGELELFGATFARERAAILARMNMISPYLALPGQLTVRQNLALYADLYDVPKPGARIGELLARFGCEALADVRVAKLSSGQSARANLCRAFLNAPELLLLDEPAAHLDAEGAERLRTHLHEERAARGISVLLTSHDARDLDRLCDRLLLLAQGAVIADGSALDVTRAVLGDQSAAPALGDAFLGLR